jgi:hypothetical protein
LQTGLQQALGHLTKRQREAVFFKFYQNLPYEQIASAMNVNAQSVYNLIFAPCGRSRSTSPPKAPCSPCWLPWASPEPVRTRRPPLKKVSPHQKN